MERQLSQRAIYKGVMLQRLRVRTPGFPLLASVGLAALVLSLATV